MATQSRKNGLVQPPLCPPDVDTTVANMVRDASAQTNSNLVRDLVAMLSCPRGSSSGSGSGSGSGANSSRGVSRSSSDTSLNVKGEHDVALANAVRIMWGDGFFQAYPSTTPTRAVHCGSANACFVIYQTAAAKAGAKAPTHMFVKFALENASDKLFNDAVNSALIRCALDTLPNYSKHYMEYYTAFAVPQDAFVSKSHDLRNATFNIPSRLQVGGKRRRGGGMSGMSSQGSPRNTGALVEPLVDAYAAAAIPGVSLHQYLMEAVDVDEVCRKAACLFSAIMALGELTGMAHNDLHDYNVFFDTVTNNLRIIDYGQCTFDTKTKFVSNLLTSPVLANALYLGGSGDSAAKVLRSKDENGGHDAKNLAPLAPYMNDIASVSLHIAKWAGLNLDAVVQKTDKWQDADEDSDSDDDESDEEANAKAKAKADANETAVHLKEFNDALYREYPALLVLRPGLEWTNHYVNALYTVFHSMDPAARASPTPRTFVAAHGLIAGGNALHVGNQFVHHNEPDVIEKMATYVGNVSVFLAAAKGTFDTWARPVNSRARGGGNTRKSQTAPPALNTMLQAYEHRDAVIAKNGLGVTESVMKAAGQVRAQAAALQGGGRDRLTRGRATASRATRARACAPASRGTRRATQSSPSPVSKRRPVATTGRGRGRGRGATPTVVPPQTVKPPPVVGARGVKPRREPAPAPAPASARSARSARSAFRAT
jgi:hypothetical protein